MIVGHPEHDNVHQGHDFLCLFIIVFHQYVLFKLFDVLCNQTQAFVFFLITEQSILSLNLRILYLWLALKVRIEVLQVEKRFLMKLHNSVNEDAVRLLWVLTADLVHDLEGKLLFLMRVQLRIDIWGVCYGVDVGNQTVCQMICIQVSIRYDRLRLLRFLIKGVNIGVKFASRLHHRFIDFK